jgi:hypothetical protein
MGGRFATKGIHKNGTQNVYPYRKSPGDVAIKSEKHL